MKVRFTPAAEANLGAIAEWISSEDPDAALRLVQQLRRKALDIGDMPLAFPVLAGNRDEELRKRTHRHHVIIYRVTAEVEIVRVIDARRDYLPLVRDL